MSGLIIDGSVTARAGVNIALVKYWGKAPGRGPQDLNLPAVPSLSLTLEEPWTETTVRFDPEAEEDSFVLDGEQLGEASLAQARPVLERVRELASVRAPFAVESVNRVPTAAGLASSASGMAALAVAALRCAGLEGDLGLASRVARLGSGSAARSVFGGWVAWEGREARQVAPPEQLDVIFVVAILDAGPKPLSSRAAMLRTASTSPYYAGWVEQARHGFDEALDALDRKDLGRLIAAMEASTLRMHACAMAARPAILYWQPGSVSVIRAVERLREKGLVCGWTMDAGPNVKVLCARHDASTVVAELKRIDDIRSILLSGPGGGTTATVRS